MRIKIWSGVVGAVLSVVGVLSFGVFVTSFAAQMPQVQSHSDADAAMRVISAPGPSLPLPSSMNTGTVNGGFVQFNSITVESISGTSLPAEIVAGNPNQCWSYATKNDSVGAVIPCSMETNDRGIGVTSNGAIPPSGAPLPLTPTPSSLSIRVIVDAATQIMLRDRTPVSLSSISIGDQLNVFGYYNTDGSVQAYLIRDLSKPVQNQFLQLNNVQIVSMATGTAPSLVVAQANSASCYGFGQDGNARQGMIACPMGATLNIAPAVTNPQWLALRKYIINIGAQTVILDSNHTQLQLSDLQVGDRLNIYGDTSDNGQTLNADIIRDLSIPAAVSSYSGTVSQVNGDGSFIIMTDGGQTITVQNPVQVGATVHVSGLLDRLKNVLSEVSSMSFGSGTMQPPTLMMVNPGVRIQGSAEPATGDVPNGKQ